MLWDRFGPGVAFGLDAALAAVSGVLFLVLILSRRRE
jgi:hypothetical protein